MQSQPDSLAAFHCGEKSWSVAKEAAIIANSPTVKLQRLEK
jgi:hypothetical protein